MVRSCEYRRSWPDTRAGKVGSSKQGGCHPTPTPNHSVGMLAYHLWFWDARALAKFKNQTVPKAPGNNDETFNDFDAATWTKTVHDLDQVMASLEDLVAQASDADLAKWGTDASKYSHTQTRITRGKFFMCGSCRARGIPLMA